MPQLALLCNVSALKNHWREDLCFEIQSASVYKLKQSRGTDRTDL